MSVYPSLHTCGCSGVHLCIQRPEEHIGSLRAAFQVLDTWLICMTWDPSLHPHNCAASTQNSWAIFPGHFYTATVKGRTLSSSRGIQNSLNRHPSLVVSQVYTFNMKSRGYQDRTLRRHLWEFNAGVAHRAWGRCSLLELYPSSLPFIPVQPSLA